MSALRSCIDEDDTKIGETAVRDFLLGERPPDDAGHLAASSEDGVRNRAHEPKSRASVDQADIARGEVTAQPFGSRSIRWSRT